MEIVEKVKLGTRKMITKFAPLQNYEIQSIQFAL